VSAEKIVRAGLPSVSRIRTIGSRENAKKTGTNTNKNKESSPSSFISIKNTGAKIAMENKLDAIRMILTNFEFLFL
jgi:hypothetical protein